MADFFLSNLKSTLDNCITELDKIHSMFCRNPESDFTRNRKLSFRKYIQFMLQMQSKSVSNEILDFFEHSLFAPSKSAFTQQRYKLLPEGWDFLFHSFINQCRTLSDNLYNGYRLLACDGSDVNISRNPADERTFIHEGKKVTMQFISMHCMISPIRPTAISLCRGKRNFMNALHLTQ